MNTINTYEGPDGQYRVITLYDGEVYLVQRVLGFGHHNISAYSDLTEAQACAQLFAGLEVRA